MPNRSLVAAIGVTAAVLVLIAVLFARGWVDYALLGLALLLLVGAYAQRRGSRASVDDHLRESHGRRS